MKKPNLRKGFPTSLAFAALAGISFCCTALADDNEPDAAAKKEVAKLEIGSSVPSLQLEGIEWLQGEPVSSLNEEGKVYMIECWATWCGPCIASIPHINELHKKFGDKGFVIVGMNVWEDGIEKAKDFVSGQGDKMSYRVAYSGGKGSEFENKWLKAADIKGIPRALLVMDGKLVLSVHPSEVDDALVESMLKGEFDREAFSKKQEAREQRSALLMNKLGPLMRNGEWEKAKQFANEDIGDSDPELRDNILMAIATSQGDWKAIQAHAAELETDAAREEYLGQVAFSGPVGDSVDLAKAVAADALKIFTADMVSGQSSNMDKIMKGLIRMRYLSISGDKEGALEAIEFLNGVDAAQMKDWVKKVLEKASESIEGGTSVAPLRSLMR